MSRKEVDYYEEILEFFLEHIKSDFVSQGLNYGVYGACNIELSQGLNNLIITENITCTQLDYFLKSIQMLNVDIFILVTKEDKYELVILEVKKEKSVGLTELAQLIGYCITSCTKYGVLINVDGGPSPRLKNILAINGDVSLINRLINGEVLTHRLGLMTWNSTTKRVMLTNLGELHSIDDICKGIKSSLG